MSLKLYGNSKIILGATSANTGTEVSLQASSAGLDIKRGNDQLASIYRDETFTAGFENVVGIGNSLMSGYRGFKDPLKSTLTTALSDESFFALATQKLNGALPVAPNVGGVVNSEGYFASDKSTQNMGVPGIRIYDIYSNFYGKLNPFMKSVITEDQYRKNASYMSCVKSKGVYDATNPNGISFFVSGLGANDSLGYFLAGMPGATDSDIKGNDEYGEQISLTDIDDFKFLAETYYKDLDTLGVPGVCVLPPTPDKAQVALIEAEFNTYTSDALNAVIYQYMIHSGAGAPSTDAEKVTAGGLWTALWDPIWADLETNFLTNGSTGDKYLVTATKKISELFIEKVEGEVRKNSFLSVLSDAPTRHLALTAVVTANTDTDYIAAYDAALVFYTGKSTDSRIQDFSLTLAGGSVVSLTAQSMAASLTSALSLTFSVGTLADTDTVAVALNYFIAQHAADFAEYILGTAYSILFSTDVAVSVPAYVYAQLLGSVSLTTNDKAIGMVKLGLTGAFPDLVKAINDLKSALDSAKTTLDNLIANDARNVSTTTKTAPAFTLSGTSIAASSWETYAAWVTYQKAANAYNGIANLATAALNMVGTVKTSFGSIDANSYTGLTGDPVTDNALASLFKRVVNALTAQTFDMSDDKYHISAGELATISTKQQDFNQAQINAFVPYMSNKMVMVDINSVIDTFTVEPTTDEKLLFSDDGTHLSALGNEVNAYMLVKVINEKFGSTKALPTSTNQPTEFSKFTAVIDVHFRNFLVTAADVR